MGAKGWLLAWWEQDPREVLSSAPVLDRAAARRVAERVYPEATVREISDGVLGESCSPRDGVTYVGCWPGLTIVATDRVTGDRPSELPRHLVLDADAPTVLLHAMHSVVDWFAYALWAEGTLRRSLSVSPGWGVIEDLGRPLPFEEPYWAGRHPAVDPDEREWDEDPYPLAFHPLELAEEALVQFLGFRLEGKPVDGAVDPYTIPLAGFLIS